MTNYTDLPDYHTQVNMQTYWYSANRIEQQERDPVQPGMSLVLAAYSYAVYTIHHKMHYEVPHKMKVDVRSHAD